MKLKGSNTFFCLKKINKLILILVSFMKRFYFGIILVLFVFSFNQKHEVVATFNETLDGYGIYKLNFEEKVLSTINFNSYFDEITVISIEPFINELYKNKVNFEIYNFEPFSNTTNINRFTSEFVSLLEHYGYKTDALMSRINGIYLKGVVIYCSLDEVNLLESELNFNFFEI